MRFASGATRPTTRGCSARRTRRCAFPNHPQRIGSWMIFCTFCRTRRAARRTAPRRGWTGRPPEVSQNASAAAHETAAPPRAHAFPPRLPLDAATAHNVAPNAWVSNKLQSRRGRHHSADSGQFAAQICSKRAQRLSTPRIAWNEPSFPLLSEHDQQRRRTSRRALPAEQKG